MCLLRSTPAADFVLNHRHLHPSRQYLLTSRRPFNKQAGTPSFIDSSRLRAPYHRLHELQILGNSNVVFSLRATDNYKLDDDNPISGSKDDLQASKRLVRVCQVLGCVLLGLGTLSCLWVPGLARASVMQKAASAKYSEILTSGWAGLMAGCLHALTGPDHLAALAPLCLGHGKLESALVGALWGCGHDAGQVIFGLMFLLLKGRLHIELVRTWASRVVGITLLAIGAVGLKEAQEVPVSVLAGEVSNSGEFVEPVKSKKNTRRLRTFAAGIVYGLQPDALLMILPALALPSKFAGAAYLCMFLAGTVLAMGSYTAFIGSCGQALEKRLPWITQRLSIASSIVAIAFGICVLVGEFFGMSMF